MNNNNSIQQTTFWGFLKNYKIEIPIIQRDYAQGRIGKEKLRRTFLNDLKNALDSNLTNGETKLKLDFVYGSIENDALNPLDGQQRLTTLWLLHWYIAYKAERLSENNGIFKHFSYETRTSSREFCARLSDFSFSIENDSIVNNIKKQTWFFSAWKQDPTIQAMLNMLNCIEIVFSDCDKACFDTYWNKLRQEECPIIFYYLDLLGLKLSDDLYLKMNARGKQLTDFENFKADLVGYIKDNDWEKEKEIRNTIAHKLDTDWTEIFWNNKSPENKIDEIYFTFINRFLLNGIITAGRSAVGYKYKQEDIEQTDLFKHIQSDTYREYNSFDIYLEEDSFSEAIRRMENVLDNFHKVIDKEHVKSLFSPSWSDDSQFYFIPEYKGENPKYNISSITQPQRVVFYAICCYFEKGEYEEISLKRWMRVVWNIVGNGNITTIQAMVGAMRLIDELANYSRSLYENLADTSIQIKSGFASEQIKEEKEKACIIIKEEEKINWEEKIIEAEKTAFFKGTIHFLYRADDNKGVDWDSFDARFENAKAYFDEKGVKDTDEAKYRTEAILLKAFVSRVDDAWKYLWWDKEVFDNRGETWKSLLTNSGFREIMNTILSGDLSVANKGTVEWHKKMYQTNLLSHIANNLEGARVRERDGHKAIHPPRYAGVILDMDIRDNILSELMNDNVIKVDPWHIVAGMPFFRGWDINFKWNKNDKYQFQWNIDRNIYILNDENEYLMSGDKYIFSPESEINNETCIKKFENLIQQSKNHASPPPL